MLWSRKGARYGKTRLLIRIIPSIRFDSIVYDYYFVALQQNAVKHPRINVQPDFAGVVVRNVEGLSFVKAAGMFKNRR